MHCFNHLSKGVLTLHLSHANCCKLGNTTLSTGSCKLQTLCNLNQIESYHNSLKHSPFECKLMEHQFYSAITDLLTSSSINIHWYVEG